MRLRFRKEGDLRFIGHRDLLRTLERLFRRAGLKLSHSEGFHPKPRMSFPLALAVGIVGANEVMELDLAEPCTAEQLLAAVEPHCPPGLSFLSAEAVLPGTAKPRVHRVVYEIPIPEEARARVQSTIESWLALDAHPIQRAAGTSPIDIRPLVEELDLARGVLRMMFRIPRQAGIRPRDLLEALHLADLESQGCVLVRTHVELCP
jgi:radical SAM-linked protein